jgi:hypothetical protein
LVMCKSAENEGDTKSLQWVRACCKKCFGVQKCRSRETQYYMLETYAFALEVFQAFQKKRSLS